jgi:hypothetical protein
VLVREGDAAHLPKSNSGLILSSLGLNSLLADRTSAILIFAWFVDPFISI